MGITDEMLKVIKGILDGLLRSGIWTISPSVNEILDNILDTYLGKAPTFFVYNNRTYTPVSFERELIGLKTSDYVELTSFTHHPFYSKFAIEVPDNWENGEYLNIPLDELIEIVNNAIDRGISVAWDGDVTEKSFKNYSGLATIPDSLKVGKELEISTELRQKAFEEKSTTDDHLMHIVGIGTDSCGTKYYLTKNSWGADCNSFGGYMYLSENYVRYKTIAIMVHKDAIPQKIAKKLKLQ